MWLVLDVSTWGWQGYLLVTDDGALLYFQLPDTLPGLPVTTDEELTKKDKNQSTQVNHNEDSFLKYYPKQNL